jgi:hypothetical protein
MKSGNLPGLTRLRPYAPNDPPGLIRLEADGFTDIVTLEPLIPNGGLCHQVADIQFHIGTENEVNTSRSAAFEVSDSDETKQHLTRHDVILQDEIQIHG